MAEQASALIKPATNDFREEGTVWICAIINRSTSPLKAIGVTPQCGFLENILPDILPGNYGIFRFRRSNYSLRGASGVVHFLVTDVGIVLNIMASISAGTLGHFSGWCNVRVCNWKESFDNLYYGTGGCHMPIQNGNVRSIDGCEFKLSSYSKLGVAYNCDSSAAIPLPCDITLSLVDKHYDMLNKNIYMLCVIVNKSPHVLQFDGFSERNTLGCTVYDNLIQPNETSMLVCDWTNAPLWSGRFMSGVIYYKIKKTSYILNIMSNVNVKSPNSSSCTATVFDQKFCVNLLGDLTNAGNYTSTVNCHFVMSSMYQSTFIVVFRPKDKFTETAD